jgi:hypothetical protein
MKKVPHYCDRRFVIDRGGGFGSELCSDIFWE